MYFYIRMFEDTPEATRHLVNQKIGELNQFSDAAGKEPHFYGGLGKILLLLDLRGANPVETARVEAYIRQHIAATQKGIGTNCDEVARDTLDAGLATNIIYTDADAYDFVVWDNHFIGVDTLADGSVLAVDLTAAANITHGQGQFDILAIRADSMESLCVEMGDLYGGQWQILS
jgi:hypothetical protein